MSNFQNFVNNGSNQNLNAAPVNTAKPRPFPLENIDGDISEAYVYVDRIRGKLKASENNPVNNTPARKKHLKSLRYKTDTCLKLLKEISEGFADFWF